MNFEKLILQIQDTHVLLQKKALTSLNINLTIRNWIIGLYIVEFEQQGSDRAAYGKQLLQNMANHLKHIKGLSHRNLKTFRTFYLSYPQIAELFTKKSSLSIINELNSTNSFFVPNKKSIRQFATAQLKNDSSKVNIPIEKLITSLSFTHLVEIIRINDSLKRVFYEIEAIKGNWSVKELKRQINTLLFERTGMSKNKPKTIHLANKNSQTQNIEDLIRNPYFFEFVALKDKDVVSEKDLETALLNNLQEFILEMGEGFCFEARQKRITIGSKYYRIDLVFYHRILKCHVLIELKTDEVDYAAITQLNTYVSYYRKEVMQENDKPTIGILLCTNKDEAFVEYALAGLDEKIFISKYLLYIPTKLKLEEFIKNEIKKY